MSSYCISLRDRDAAITGWYDGSKSNWTTDHRRAQTFATKQIAEGVAAALREFNQNNADLINVDYEP